MPHDRRTRRPTMLLLGQAGEDARRRVQGEIDALKATHEQRPPGLGTALSRTAVFYACGCGDRKWSVRLRRKGGSARH